MVLILSDADEVNKNYNYSENDTICYTKLTNIGEQCNQIAKKNLNRKIFLKDIEKISKIISKTCREWTTLDVRDIIYTA